MYIRSIAEFIIDAKRIGASERDSTNGIIAELMAELNHTSDSEKRSWENSLPALAKVLEGLGEELKNACEIALEFRYHSDERADAVIFGTFDGRPVAIIIENKQWSELDRYTPTGDTCLIDPYHDSIYTVHPSYQVAHFKFILENTNSFIQDNNASVFTAVFMHNASEQERQEQVGPFASVFDTKLKDSPIFVGADGTNNPYSKNLKEYIDERINGGQKGLAKTVYSAERAESPEYIAAMAKLFDDDEEFLQLFDEEQIALFEQIRQTVDTSEDNPNKTVFIVEGSAGTGKTFVAARLISYLYNEAEKRNCKQVNCKLIIKNRDPRRALLRKGMPKSAISPGLKKDESAYRCLICDESHRMLKHVWQGEDGRNNIKTIIRQSNVSVFFFDEKQQVHANDYVTTERIKEEAQNQGVSENSIFQLKLEHQHRCLDSDHFMQLIDRILYEPDKGLDGIEEFSEDENYRVRMVNSHRELFYLIQQLNEDETEGSNSSRVLAGKGRTKGVDWTWPKDNAPDSEKRTVGPFRKNDETKYIWNRHSYPDNESFASDDTSVNLVGCLDTSQGLDFEYVGLIFSPDIIYNPENDSVKINLDGHQEEDPNLKIKEKRGSDEELLLERLIRNTYRVLASRGAKGCFIYCCDEGLQNYLGRLIPKEDVAVPDDYTTYPDLAVIGNSARMNYHRDNCRFAPKSHNKKVVFASAGEAERAGYSPCPTCFSQREA